MVKSKVKKEKKADVVQTLDVFFKEYSDRTTKLVIQITKGTKQTTIYKEPIYLKQLRDHLQNVAKIGMKKNLI